MYLLIVNQINFTRYSSFRLFSLLLLSLTYIASYLMMVQNRWYKTGGQVVATVTGTSLSLSMVVLNSIGIGKKSYGFVNFRTLKNNLAIDFT